MVAVGRDRSFILYHIKATKIGKSSVKLSLQLALGDTDFEWSLYHITLI